MQSSEDEVYAEVGRNWAGIIEFAQSLGFELDNVQFKHTNGNVATMSLKDLQGSRGIALLRILLIGARAIPSSEICLDCHKRFRAGIPGLEAPWCPDCENK